MQRQPFYNGRVSGYPPQGRPQGRPSQQGGGGAPPPMYRGGRHPQGGVGHPQQHGPPRGHRMGGVGGVGGGHEMVAPPQGVSGAGGISQARFVHQGLRGGGGHPSQGGPPPGQIPPPVTMQVPPQQQRFPGGPPPGGLQNPSQFTAQMQRLQIQQAAQTQAQAQAQMKLAQQAQMLRQMQMLGASGTGGGGTGAPTPGGGPTPGSYHPGHPSAQIQMPAITSQALYMNPLLYMNRGNLPQFGAPALNFPGMPNPNLGGFQINPATGLPAPVGSFNPMAAAAAASATGNATGAMTAAASSTAAATQRDGKDKSGLTPGKGSDNNELYVGNLDWSVTEARLIELFSPYGKVTDCSIIQNESDVVKHPNYAFITFEKKEDAKVAMHELRYTLLMKRAMHISWKVHEPSRLGRFRQQSRLFVKNLHPEIDERSVYEMFFPYGSIIECEIPARARRVFGCYALVTFDNVFSAHQAIHALNGRLLDGQEIRVEFYRPGGGRPPNPLMPPPGTHPGAGGGPGGGGGGGPPGTNSALAGRMGPGGLTHYNEPGSDGVLRVSKLPPDVLSDVQLIQMLVSIGIYQRTIASVTIDPSTRSGYVYFTNPQSLRIAKRMITNSLFYSRKEQTPTKKGKGGKKGDEEEDDGVNGLIKKEKGAGDMTGAVKKQSSADQVQPYQLECAIVSRAQTVSRPVSRQKQSPGKGQGSSSTTTMTTTTTTTAAATPTVASALAAAAAAAGTTTATTTSTMTTNASAAVVTPSVQIGQQQALQTQQIQPNPTSQQVQTPSKAVIPNGVSSTPK